MKSTLPAPTAKEINEAHRLARSSAETAVQHAIKCGQLLAAKKEELEHGEFKPWIEKNCEFSYRTGAVYMKAADQKCRGLHFSSLNQLLTDTSAPRAKPVTPEPQVMNPPESAARGSEAGNQQKAHVMGIGAVHRAAETRPVEAAPPSVSPPDSDEPERPDDVDEDAALTAAEADYARRVGAIMNADDRLAEASAQLKQQAALIGTLEITRDGYMRGKEAVTKLLQAEQRKVAKLEKELAKLRDENESIRERVAIMEAA